MPGRPYRPTFRAMVAEKALYKTHHQVARECGIPQPTVTRWVHLKATTGDTLTKKRSGRPSKCSKRDLRCIHRIICQNRRLKHAQILALLEEIDIHIGLTKLRGIMKDFGFSRRKTRVKPFITDENKSKRVEYARNCKGDARDDWRRTIYVDEAAIKLNGSLDTWVSRKDGEAFLEECLVAKLLGGSESIMVWGGIWYGGRSDLIVFDTSESEAKKKGVTAKIYREQVMGTELKHCWRHVNGLWRGYGGARIVEDNARIHTAKENMELRKK